jgi:hypothetical protein
MVSRKSPDYKNPLEWVERLGGWAVVVFIVWWLTTRWETVMNAQLVELKMLTSTIQSSQSTILLSIDTAMQKSTTERAKILEEILRLRNEQMTLREERKNQ